MDRMTLTGKPAMDRVVPVSEKTLSQARSLFLLEFTEKFMTFVFSQALKFNDFHQIPACGF